MSGGKCLIPLAFDCANEFRHWDRHVAFWPPWQKLASGGEMRTRSQAGPGRASVLASLRPQGRKESANPQGIKPSSKTERPDFRPAISHTHKSFFLVAAPGYVQHAVNVAELPSPASHQFWGQARAGCISRWYCQTQEPLRGPILHFVIPKAPGKVTEIRSEC